MTLAIGLIGVAGYGQLHLEQILKLNQEGRAKLAAVTVHDQAGLQSLPPGFKGLGIPLFSNYNDMLRVHRGRLDLCCIPTPIHWHGIMSVDCLRGGAHVIVEKPLAGSIEECRMIRSAQKESGKIVAVGFQNVYDPSTLRIKERLLSGTIGTIKRMSGYGLSPRSLAYYGRTNWAGKLYQDGRPVLDSPANNAMAHYLQWLLFIGGPSPMESLSPTFIEAELYRANPIDAPDTVNLRIENNRGFDIRFAVSHASKIKVEMKLEIEGTRGTLVWRQNDNAELRLNNGPVETIPVPTHREMQMGVIERVIEYLEWGNGFVCTPEQAEMHTRCIVAAHRATSVMPIDQQHITALASNGSIINHINGICEAVREAATKNLSFSALGVPWAPIPPERFPVPRV